MKLILVLLIGFTLTSCSEDSVSVSRAAKKPVKETVKNFHHTNPGKLPSNMGKGHRLKSYSWVAPKSWEEKPVTSMRIGSYKVFDKAKEASADLSVVVLSLNGGGVSANFNRWRSQVGLKTLMEGEMSASLKSIQAKVGTFKYSLIKNKTSAILGAVYLGSTNALFIKMTGNASVVSENLPEFLTFLRGIHASSN